MSALRLTEKQYADFLKRQTYVCAHCAKPFTPAKHMQKYCDKNCNSKARQMRQRNGVPKTWGRGKEYVPRRSCQRCGARFYAPPVQVRRGGGKFCSNGCRTADMAHHPENYPQVSGRRGRVGKRADLDDRFFRSSWEANYARYLNWLKARGEIIAWEYESKTFQFEGITRGSRFYTPDFKVISAASYAWHEIKGYMDQKSATKLDRFARYFPNEPLLLIGKKEYEAIASTMRPFLPNWEARR